MGSLLFLEFVAVRILSSFINIIDDCDEGCIFFFVWFFSLSSLTVFQKFTIIGNLFIFSCMAQGFRLGNIHQNLHCARTFFLRSFRLYCFRLLLCWTKFLCGLC